MSKNRYKWIKRFDEIGIRDIPDVGGKNASLGEMYSQLTDKGIRVPDGFAVTANAYRAYLEENKLAERISDALAGLDITDVDSLAVTAGSIRAWISSAEFPVDIADEITAAYREMETRYGKHLDVAVRSSATAEDLPDASFAGQQETYLNISGTENLLLTCRQVLASLFTDRAIAYRVHKGFAHMDVALSIGVQQMVRADRGASGVMFTLDTESGFRDVVLVTSAYGLGENVVGGAVNPDEFLVFKPTLTGNNAPIIRRRLGNKHIKMIYTADNVTGPTTKNVAVHRDEQQRFSISDREVLELARMAVAVEKHYSNFHGHDQPMDIEWARDGNDGKLYIVQARPETVHSSHAKHVLKTYTLERKGEVLASGRSVGRQIGAGKARIILEAAHMNQLEPGDVLITDITDPDWEPVMRKASAIVTNRGGRVCHAAIIARELGIPAIVGTNDATLTINDGAPVTVSCAEGDVGNVYAGELPFTVDEQAADQATPEHTGIMLNIGNPGNAFELSALPSAGVGLARIEFIIANSIGIHPRALLEYDNLDADTRAAIDQRIAGFDSPTDFYRDYLAEGVATIAAAFYPRPVYVRLGDFKSNEYAALLGGSAFEPHEENPMLGLRGAVRYYAPGFEDSFKLECAAIHKARSSMGLNNINLLIPFVRTTTELDKILELLAANGLARGQDGLRVNVMCELPANVIRADAFLELCDGFSIGSNDLTQLTLGVDRDSSLPGNFDERDPAVLEMISIAIAACRRNGKYSGICGQAPSDFPELASWLVEQGIDSISVNRDALITVTRDVIAAETKTTSSAGVHAN